MLEGLNEVEDRITWEEAEGRDDAWRQGLQAAAMRAERSVLA